MIEHSLFPTLLLEFKYDKKDQFKEIFFNSVLKYTNENGKSNEYTGHVNIHHEEAFKPFYAFVTSCIKKYIRRLHLNPDEFEYYVTKSWLNINNKKATPKHSHADGHMSFAYYINLPENNQQKIRFYNIENRYEPYSHCIEYNNPSNWDEYNSYTWDFLPTEGQLFVFPGNLPHSTVGNSYKMLEDMTEDTIEEPGYFIPSDLKTKRICISADFMITFKEKLPRSMGVQPISNWRMFDDSI